MRNDRPNPIINITFKFALEVIKYAEELEDNKKFVIVRQLLKSGTSVGANVR
jgi:four helix bundle protein